MGECEGECEGECKGECEGELDADFVGFPNNAFGTGGSRFAYFWATLVPSGEFPKGNSKADLDERIRAWGRDEWTRLKGLGLRFTVLLMLVLGLRTFLTWRTA